MSAGVTGLLPTGNDFPVPRSIRGVLLPEEAGDFDREYRAAMAQATETLDLTGVLQLLERWRRVAESSRDAVAIRFGNVYGPWCVRKRGVLNVFFESIHSGVPLIIYGDGSASRD
jgi:hypothetical protein